MTEGSARVAVPCPVCSPSTGTVHEILKEGGQATVRCSECEHVHKATLPSSRSVDIRVVISQSDESTTTTTTVGPDEELTVGNEFVVETDEAIHQVRVTSLEGPGDRRVDRARADDVRTVWTRAVDNVAVNVTIHPNDGRRGESRSETLYVPGDHEFTVGDHVEHDGDRFRITGIHVTDDSTGYERPTLRRRGDTVPAKDVKRLYGNDEEKTAWSAW